MLNASELAGMRATSQSALPDEIEITEPATSTTYDPTTHTETPGEAAVVYRGRGRVRTPRATDMERIFGDREVTVQRYVCVIPWDVAGVRRDCRVRILSGSDPDVTNRTWRVVSVSGGANFIDRTLGIEEVDG